MSPLKVLGSVERKQQVGVEVCTAHGANCKKYPDHPVVRGGKPDQSDLKFAEMVRTGRLLGQLKELTAAGYEIPEEFTRGNEDPPKSDRVREFFERYDLGKHFPREYPEPPKECKTRKLSDDELRQRREHADAVRAARKKNQLPPLAPWNKFDPKLAEEFARRRGQYTYEAEKAKTAEKAKRLIGDLELARKLQEARETWVNSAPRNRRHIQDVREGYGDAVPEFEEME